MGNMGSNSVMDKWISNAAKEVGVDRHLLGKAVEKEKAGTGRKYTNLDYAEIIVIAKELKAGLIHVK